MREGGRKGERKGRLVQGGSEGRLQGVRVQ